MDALEAENEKLDELSKNFAINAEEKAEAVACDYVTVCLSEYLASNIKGHKLTTSTFSTL